MANHGSTTTNGPVQKEKIFNVPNLLSGYRLLAFPVTLSFALSGNEQVFVILICISLVTDVLDGFIARTFHLVTRFGGALDNLADLGTYTAALYGVFRFRWDAIRPHVGILYVFLAALLFSYSVAWIRFRKMPGLHLYSGMIKATLQGVFFFVLFAWGFWPWLFYLAAGWGILAYIEKTAVLFLLEDITPNTKGLYWLIKRRRAKSGG
jgi:CDP-diacylglycerol--glycerol-3-phosphate 3-phosphatidyltransferase